MPYLKSDGCILYNFKVSEGKQTNKQTKLKENF